MLDLLLGGQIVTFVLLGLVLVAAITVHEFAHAWAATRQGDPTAKLAGRLTLDPRRHLDPIGTLFLVIAGFGWGKPVPFTPSALRSKRFGAAIVAVAGPTSNILMAALAAVIGRFASGDLAIQLLGLAIFYNCLLAVFNLVPVPPLDGSRILSALLPPRHQHIVYFLDKWGFVVLLLIVFIPQTSRMIFLAARGVQALILRVFG